MNAHTRSSPWEGSGLVLLCLPWDSAASSKSSCPWGSFSWGAGSLFVVPPPPPLCPALRRVAQEVSAARLPRRAPQGDPTLPSLRLGLQRPPPRALPHPEPLTQETDESRPSICPLVGLLAAPCPSLHPPRALSQRRSIPRLQVAGAEASRAGHLSRMPRVSVGRTRS